MQEISKLGEEDLLRFIIEDLQHFSNAFGFMERSAIGGYLPDWSLECHLSVKTGELGLPVEGKPGDIDVLLIPKFDGERFAERSMAIEAKRFVVRKDKRERSPTSFGITQTHGLVSYGFPLVGLLHVAIVEQSDRSEWIEIPIVGEVPSPTSQPSLGKTKVDPANVNVSKRHAGRFAHFELPEFVGFNSHTVELSDDGFQITGWSVGEERHPTKNRQTDTALIERLRRFPRLPELTVKRRAGAGEVIQGGG